MSQERNIVANVTLHKNRPTKLSFGELYTWVIWQFPRKKGGGLCGAVHPPIADHGWYPAVIHIKAKRVQVHAHLGKLFPSPEAAAEHLNNGKR